MSDKFSIIPTPFEKKIPDDAFRVSGIVQNCLNCKKEKRKKRKSDIKNIIMMKIMTMNIQLTTYLNIVSSEL